jgi:hypothetical protein
MWALKVTRSTMAATRGVGDDLPPFAERPVGGQRDQGFLCSFGEDLEQKLGASAVELDVAEFVQAERVEAAVSGHDPRQAAFVGCFAQLVDQLGGCGVTHPPSLVARRDPKAYEQVALSRAGTVRRPAGPTRCSPISSSG